MRYILIIAAYILGSIPFGIICARLFGGVDPRTTGSRNIGATNVRRSAGKTAAACTLILDILKGALPVLTARAFGLPYGVIAIIGSAAFLGHLYPVFLGFKGGKGVATACGVMFVISPIATAIALCIFIIVVALKKYVSLASIAAALSMPLSLYLLRTPGDYIGLGLFIAFFIILKHKANIIRLLSGVENKI